MAVLKAHILPRPIACDAVHDDVGTIGQRDAPVHPGEDDGFAGVRREADPINGGKERRSRKWVLAIASLTLVTIFAVFGLLTLAKDAGDFALIIGVWAGSDTTILGLYGAANVMEKKGASA